MTILATTAAVIPLEEIDPIPKSLELNPKLLSLYLLLGFDFIDEKGNTLLHTAAKEGDEAWVSFLLEKGVDPTIRNSSGNTALHHSSEENHLENTRKLGAAVLKLGKTVDLTNDEGYTPLHLAAIRGALPCIDVLLCLGAQIDFENIAAQEHALGLAVSAADIDMVRKLLSLGASPNVKDTLGNTVLHTAVGIGCKEIVMDLLIAGAEVSANNEGSSPIHLAAMLGHAKILEVFADRGISLEIPNEEGLTPIFLSVLNDSESCLDVLLARSISPLTLGPAKNSLLHIAMMVKSYKLVEKLAPLCKEIIDLPNSSGFSPLAYAVKTNDIPMLSVLIDNGALMNFSSESLFLSPFHYAIKCGYFEIVELMLKRDPSLLHKRSSTGLTPYLMAYRMGHKHILPLLDDDPYSRLFIALAELGHISGLKGNVAHPLGDIPLEGSDCYHFYYKIAESIPEEFVEIKEKFEEAGRSLRSADEIAESVKQKKLTIIPAGWKGHSICVVIQDNVMIVCNRGQRIDGVSTFKTYIIDSSKISSEVINTIKTITNEAELSEAFSFYYDKLPTILSPIGARVDSSSSSFCAAVEEIAPKSQKVANCCAASAKTAVRAAFVLALLRAKGESFHVDDIAHARKISKQVTLSMRASAEWSCSSLIFEFPEYCATVSEVVSRSISKRSSKVFRL